MFKETTFYNFLFWLFVVDMSNTWKFVSRHKEISGIQCKERKSHMGKESVLFDTGRGRFKKRCVEVRKKFKEVKLDVFNLIYLEQRSTFNARIMHLGILLKCRFWFSELGWGLRVFHFCKLPGDAEVSGLWGTSVSRSLVIKMFSLEN